jgi:hypothetical protein
MSEIRKYARLSTQSHTRTMETQNSILASTNIHTVPVYAYSNDFGWKIEFQFISFKLQPFSSRESVFLVCFLNKLSLCSPVLWKSIKKAFKRYKKSYFWTYKSSREKFFSNEVRTNRKQNFERFLFIRCRR